MIVFFKDLPSLQERVLRRDLDLKFPSRPTVTRLYSSCDALVCVSFSSPSLYSLLPVHGVKPSLSYPVSSNLSDLGPLRSHRYHSSIYDGRRSSPPPEHDPSRHRYPYLFPVENRLSVNQVLFNVTYE